jgi:NADPH-ferrihemoprotein reductase
VVIEDDFNDWKKDLWTELKQKIPPLSENGQNGDSTKAPATAFVAEVHDGSAQAVELTHDLLKDPMVDYEFITKQWLSGVEVPVTTIKELRQTNEFGSTLHLELDLTNTNLTYMAAANCLIFPENDHGQVKELADFLGVDLNAIFSLKSAEQQRRTGTPNRKPKFPFPSPIKVETALKHFCDLNGPLKKNVLRSLSEFIPDEATKQKLAYLAAPQGKEEFDKLVEGEHKTLIDILKEYKIKLTLDQFIELSARIAPRYYTIASSSTMHAKSLHIVVSMVSEPLPGGKSWSGLVTQQLLNLHKDFKSNGTAKLRITVLPSTFILPEHINTPTIMIGPGTGIAPFRAFLQEKASTKDCDGDKKRFGKVSLFFGCRKRDSDYIYKEEMQAWANQKIIDEYHLAFSREAGQKVYVQHLLKQNAEEIVRLIVEQRANFYVCGATSMGKEVKSLILQLLNEKLGPVDGKKFLDEMEARKAFIMELWGK